jgi:hypothetical protein
LREREEKEIKNYTRRKACWEIKSYAEVLVLQVLKLCVFLWRTARTEALGRGRLSP